MSHSTDFLREEFTIDTPENVTFGYEIAGIGSRFIGALVDTLLLFIALAVLNIVAGIVFAQSAGAEKLFTQQTRGEIGWAGGIVLALYALINFALFWGYYIFFELVWNGQTPGKRIAKVRVVRMDGDPAGFIEIAVRNLVRMIDFLPGAYGVGLITMFFNARTRRLGDFAAGTLVVKDRVGLTLADLGHMAPRNRVISPTPNDSASDLEAAALAQQFPHLRRLSAAEIDLVQDALNRYAAGKVDGAVVRRLATAIATKLDLPDPAQDWRIFLTDLAEAYRRAG